MHFEQQKMDIEPVQVQDPYSLNVQGIPISEQKAKSLQYIAKKYLTLQKKFKSQPFFSREQYYIISKKWIQRWKVYVGYNQFSGALPPKNNLGCGNIPIANQDIIDKQFNPSFQFNDSLDHYNIKLKPDLQEGKDYEFITKQMYYALKDCEDYQMKKIVRLVTDSDKGKIVQLYYFNINIMVLSNFFFYQIQYEKKNKSLSLNFQYSHYATIEQFYHDLYDNLKKIINQASYTIELDQGLPLKVWLLPPGFQKVKYFLNLKQSCIANQTRAYRIYLQADLLEKQKKLNQYDIFDSSQLIAEIKQKNQGYTFYNSKNTYIGPCNQCRQTKQLKYLCACKNATYCSSSCKQRNKQSHSSRCPKGAQSDQEQKQLKLTPYSKRCRTGLQNLGNTCFMNSGIQCIAHIQQLLNYFTLNRYVEEINKENPLGTRGQLSTCYAKLLQNMWFGQSNSVVPSALKRSIGKYQPMFSGYSQHDSSQLINYLLDGLHQDLNRIKKKPYVQLKDSNGRPDKIVAAQAWQGFTKRNQSIIVDMLYGQFKSVLDCPNCKNQSVQFDPFLMCSLPLVNTNKKTLELIFIKNHIYQTKYKISYVVNEQQNVTYATKIIKQKQNLSKQSKLVFYKIGHSQINIFQDDTTLQSIRRQISSYRKLYVRQLLKHQDPQKDVKVLISHKILTSLYGPENYPKQITQSKLYFFGKNFTYKQMHYLIYSYFKPLYQVSQYQRDVINVQQVQQPLRIIVSSYYYSFSNCQFCGQKSCRGCRLKFSDDKFLQGIDKQKIQLYIFWRKNTQHIKQTFQKNEKSQQFNSKSKGGIDIQQCFQFFQQPQILEQGNQWYCPSCKDHVRAKKQMQIYRAPKILIFALKRFKRKNYSSQKNQIYVDYPIQNLDLSKYVIDPYLPTHFTDSQNKQDSSPKLIYDLIAVSNHMGSTGGGHYTAYCKDINSQDWYEFDDNYVTKISSQKVVSSSGYVLFYRRRN